MPGEIRRISVREAGAVVVYHRDPSSLPQLHGDKAIGIVEKTRSDGVVVIHPVISVEEEVKGIPLKSPSVRLVYQGMFRYSELIRRQPEELKVVEEQWLSPLELGGLCSHDSVQWRRFGRDRSQDENFEAQHVDLLCHHFKNGAEVVWSERKCGGTGFDDYDCFDIQHEGKVIGIANKVEDGRNVKVYLNVLREGERFADDVNAGDLQFKADSKIARK